MYSKKFKNKNYMIYFWILLQTIIYKPISKKRKKKCMGEGERKKKKHEWLLLKENGS